MVKIVTQPHWNLSITDTLGLDIFGNFCSNIARDFTLSEVKNVLVTSVGTKIFVFNYEFREFVRKVPLYMSV